MRAATRASKRPRVGFRFRSCVLGFLAVVVPGGLLFVPAAGAAAHVHAGSGGLAWQSIGVGGAVPGCGLEVTVSQWVAFLNTVNPQGTDPHHLYSSNESASAWPRYGQINFSSRAGNRSHYKIAYPEWANKPFGFATFLRAARLINSVTNGKVLSRRAGRSGGFSFVTYTVRLSRNTETGMYNLAHPGCSATGPQTRPLRPR
jgi:hypothetical protein